MIRKRILLSLMLAALVGAAAAQQPVPLGDLARKARLEKRATASKVYTNDDIPSVTMKETPAEKAAPAEAAASSQDATANPAEDRQKLEADWSKRIENQKREVAQLQRELDVAQRDYKTRASGTYFDIGNKLRDEKKWAEEERKFQDEISGKQKLLDAAKQKLDDLREQARKAGMPPRMLD